MFVAGSSHGMCKGLEVGGILGFGIRAQWSSSDSEQTGKGSIRPFLRQWLLSQRRGANPEGPPPLSGTLLSFHTSCSITRGQLLPGSPPEKGAVSGFLGFLELTGCRNFSEN